MLHAVSSCIELLMEAPVRIHMGFEVCVRMPSEELEIPVPTL